MLSLDVWQFLYCLFTYRIGGPKTLVRSSEHMDVDLVYGVAWLKFCGKILNVSIILVFSLGQIKILGKNSSTVSCLGSRRGGVCVLGRGRGAHVHFILLTSLWLACPPRC